MEATAAAPLNPKVIAYVGQIKTPLINRLRNHFKQDKDHLEFTFKHDDEFNPNISKRYTKNKQTIEMEDNKNSLWSLGNSRLMSTYDAGSTSNRNRKLWEQQKARIISYIY